ncbi:MAG TPA: LysE family translocator [Acidimicrobiales bacterium]|nr:LysE family translocator [Acidimicrobiales bacterium]
MATDLAAFTLAATLIVLLPGPDTLVVLRSLLRAGRRRAAVTACGVLTGLVVWVAAASFGLSALLRASHDGYLVLRIVGGAYLVWLGIQSLRARAAGVPDPTTGPHRAGVLGTGYRAGLATDLLNPKVGVFFVTFLPGFIPHGDSVAAGSLLLGAIFVVETALYFALLLAVAERVTAWLRHAKSRRRLERATGLVLIGFGLRLAIER